MKVIYSNICSANCNLPKLVAQVPDKNIDIYALTETWFKNDFVTYIPNYIFAGTGDRIGGGVGFYVKDSLKFSVLTDNCFFNENIESYCVKLTDSGDVFTVIYRPHSANPNKFLDYCEEIVNNIGNTATLKFIAGDFNYDFNSNTPCPQAITDLFASHGLKKTISEPTRWRSGRCIDNLFTNSNCNSEIIRNPDISDHLPIFFKYDTKLTTPSTIRIKDFSIKNMNSFADSLDKTNWEKLYCLEDVNQAYNLFSSRISAMYKKCFAYKIIKLNQESWITEDLRYIIKNKRKLYKLFKRRPTAENTYNYTKYRNFCNNQIRNARSSYINNKLTNARNIKEKWKIINLVTNKTKKDNTSPSTISPDEMNKHFTTIIKSNPLPNTPIDSELNPTTCALHSINETELRNIINNLSSSSAPGLDEIHPKPIKYVVNQIIAPLLFLINLTFSKGIYPENLKQASITPILKKGDPNNCNNYRPISVLSIFAKIIDKCYLYRINSFVEKCKLLSEDQFGFREGRGTEQAIVTVYSKIIDSLDASKYFLGVFLDLEKAFDSVPHQRLIQKLHRAGLRGLALDWIKSYLSNRTCVTKINNVCSKENFITIGLPQGSILSPTLFNLYINDISNIIPSGLLALYADDTILMLAHENLQMLINYANQYLEKLNMWLEKNGLKINKSKTEYIVFANIGKAISDTICNIKINGVLINRVLEYKYLGIWFDQHLNWNKHINHVVKKIAHSTYLIRKCKEFFPRNILFKLYYSFFYPHINYGISVWGNTSNNNLNRIRVLQKRVLKSVYNVNLWSSSIPLYQKSKLLNITQLYRFACLIFIDKSIKNDPRSPFELNTENTRTRSDFKLKVPLCNTAKKYTSIFFEGVKIFNEYYKNWWSLKTYPAIKNEIKNLMFNYI